MRCDLHIHSFASHDSLISKKEILALCRKRNIGAIAITDHNEIFGAIKLQKELPVKIIIGEEITTQKGEITGLFLKRKIKPGLTLRETLKQIKAQKGIVYLPHPFDTSTGRNSLGLTDVLECIKEIDLVEVFNSRTFLSRYNKKAFEFAKKYEKTMVAGSDAHSPGEIGLAGIKIDNFEKEDFLEKAKKATIFGKKSPAYVYLITKLVRLRKNSFKK